MDKWLTKEEFLNDSAEGWCWIMFDGCRYMSYFFQNEFWNDDSNDQLLEQEFITHVMPIDEPEYPKN